MLFCCICIFVVVVSNTSRLSNCSHLSPCYRSEVQLQPWTAGDRAHFSVTCSSSSSLSCFTRGASEHPHPQLPPQLCHHRRQQLHACWADPPVWCFDREYSQLRSWNQSIFSLFDEQNNVWQNLSFIAWIFQTEEWINELTVHTLYITFTFRVTSV